MARLILLTSRLPYPPREGHQLRTWHLLRALASRHQVTLLSFMRADDAPEECAELRAVVHALHLFPIAADASRAATVRSLLQAQLRGLPYVATKYASAAMRTCLRELLPGTDVIHVDMLPLIVNVPDEALALPLVLNAHNVEYQLLAQRASVESTWARRAFLANQVSKLRRFEAAACARADAVLTCSEADAQHLHALAPATPITVIPNGVDLDFNRPAAGPPAHPQQLVFVGQMGWFPNRDGVDWFLAEVLPRILAQRPDCEFLLVGKPGDLVVPAAVASRVRVAGFVPDLRTAVHDAAVYVVPLRAGSGTRLKVLEAMALGKAIVSTTIGAEGIALRDGVEVRFADTAETFAAIVLAVLADPRQARSLGASARHRAEADYGWDVIGARLCAVYAGLLDDSREASQR